jgi:hypothetical protein
MEQQKTAKRLRKFSVVVDGEVAFTWAPNPEWIDQQGGYEYIVTALASDPRIIEIPTDSGYYDQIRGGWVYENGVPQEPKEKQ